METCFNYTDGVAWCSSDEQRWINKIRKLAEERPEEVEILRQPAENYGCIYAKLPACWIKLQPPRTLSEAERERLAERARELNRKRQEEQTKIAEIAPPDPLNDYLSNFNGQTLIDY